MKHKLLLILTFLFSTNLIAQPQGINYQGIARDSSGHPILNQNISLRLIILDSSATGQAVYVETQNATTSGSGLFNLSIGMGIVVSGDFPNIPWGAGDKWLKVEMDVSGGSNYQLIGTTQFLSVPYSFYSKNSGPKGANVGDMQYWDGNAWIKLPVGPDGSSLALCNGIPTWGGCQLTLTTSATSSVTYTSAISGGTITNNNSVYIITSGICYSTSPNPTIANNKTTDGNSTTYTSIMSSLSLNTTYYVRAYVVHSFGTTYGNQVSFTTRALTTPVLTTVGAGNISSTSASSGGNISDDGGSAITVRGTCWNTSPNPTISNNLTSDGSGAGSFASNITGLTFNTTYYVRAYATNNQGTAYGNEISFTTLPTLASLSTTNAGSITTTTAVSGGNISSNGGAAVTARGVCWSTSSNPTIINSLTSDGTGNGTFTSNISGLSPGTNYFVRAYATNSQGTSYGNQISFTTLTTIPTLTTTVVGNITATSGQSGGNITSNGGAAVTARGVCWSTSPNPTTLNSLTSDGAGSGTFTSSITSLISVTTYFVRAYATNNQGTAYGNQVSFTTLPVLPTLTTTNITSITDNSAISGGNVTNDGGAPVTARGVCWNTSSNPTIANFVTNDGTGNGSYTSSLTGLTPGLNHYVRAYATNSQGTAYGNQVIFTTTITFTIGMSYGGGIIFYIDGTGQHGLIAATTDQSTALQWYNFSYLTVGTTGTAVGTGLANTNAIVNTQGPGNYAAKLCYDLVLNSRSDWYLPSKDELSLMYAIKTQIGGLQNYPYWSSSEVTNTSVWVMNGTGGFFISDKSANDGVHAIRAF